MEITGIFTDAFNRQADKAEIINNKSEFKHPPIRRIVEEKKSKYNNNSSGVQLSTGM